MKFWIFDLDGTLVDSFEHYFVILSDIFRKNDAQFSDDLRLPALTERLPDFFGQHLGTGAVADAMEMLHRRSISDASLIPTFKGVLETLRELTERGDRVAIWTNREHASAVLIIKHSGLEPFVEICVSGTCTVQRKPYPEGLLRIIDHFGCPADSVVMVGDHEHDVLAAKSAGTTAVRASWHSYWKFDPCETADHQFHHFEDFRRWAVGAH